MRRKKILIAVASAALIALFLTSNLSNVLSFTQNFLSTPHKNNSDQTATPIKHIIIIMNENHAFDNFYGVYPGVPAQYALNLSTCIPDIPSQPSPCILPFNADNISSVQETDQCHTEQCSIADYNGGAMNGFVQGENTNRTMAYYNGSGIPMLWDLASYYDLDYNFFSSAISYSESNHLFAVSANTPSFPFYNGNPASETGTFLNFTYPEIGTELTRDGISWAYYQYNWNDAVDCTGNYTTQKGLFSGGGGDGYWEGEAQFRHVQNTAVECSSLGNIKDFENALASNTLPAVSWVEPEPSESCHPGQGTLESCQLYTTSVIDDIEQSPEWSTSVTFLTYDEYGGYYDSVAPTQLDQWGDGFRVPLIAISPFTIQGLVGPCPSGKPSGAISVCTPSFQYYNNYTRASGTTNREDFSSLLSTIEYNWGVNNLTDTDGEEPNLFYMLNFSQAPLKPLFFNSNYSLAAYPLSSCLNSGGCQTGSPFPSPLSSPLYVFSAEGSSTSVNSPNTRAYFVYNATTPAWAEPDYQSAKYSGGDPDD